MQRAWCAPVGITINAGHIFKYVLYGSTVIADIVLDDGFWESIIDYNCLNFLKRPRDQVGVEYAMVCMPMGHNDE